MKLPFFSFLLLLPLSLSVWAVPHKDFSEMENRALQTWQTPTLREMLDGTLGEQVRAVYTDQFPLRSVFCRAKAWGERLLGKGENNGILFGDGGYLIPKNEYSSLAVAEQNLAAIGALAAQGGTSVSVLLVPRSIDVMVDRLPALYDPSYADGVWRLAEASGTDALIPLEVLRDAAREGQAVWYKTDHHWTTHGAYLAYVALAPTLGYAPLPTSSFTLQTGSTDFLGTSYSAAGGLAEEADEIVLYRYEGDTEYVRVTATGKVSVGFYDESALKEKDQYRVFLGGNTELLRIRSRDGEKKPRLLLIKDSFANSLLPFLALHFDVDLVDPRYDQGAISTLLSTERYDRILVVQGIDTLATDPSLSQMLARISENHSPS